MNYSHAFLDAIEDHAEIADRLGEEHPQTHLAMERVISLAPKHVQDAMLQMGAKMGLIPQAGAYLADGTPVYRLEDVAEKMGLSMDAARAFITRFDDERAAAGLSSGLVNPDQVFTKQ
jgi:hypothetical protein